MEISMGKRAGKQKEKRYFDYTLLFVTIFLAGFGMVMIYSTSSYTAQMESGNAASYFKKQLAFTGLGFAAMYATYRFDYHRWQRLALPVYVISVLLVLALIPFGSSSGGAKRWLRFGPVGIQPADVSKFAVIVLLAAMVCQCGKEIRRVRTLIILFALTALIQAVLVLVISNNMSSALIICAIAVVILFVAYPGYKLFAAFGAAVIAVFVGVYAIVSKMLDSGSSLTDNFRLNRIFVWVNPERYISGKGYQTVQALYAIGSGGLFGKGLGKSLQKLGYIPESQNDMIFSIICEELGLFGAVCVILVFAVMLWRIAHISQNAPDLFGTLLTTGVFAHIAIQVVLNIAVVTNLIPNTGVSLPFISYGGSSAVVLLAEIGIVLNVSSKIKLEV
jgi:cell division protein FtsW